MVMPMKKQEEEGLRTTRCANPDCGVLNLYTSSDKCEVCGVAFESEQSMDYKEKIRKLATEIQRWIGDQEYQGEALLHASVCCGHVGRMRFITGIAKIIENSLPSEKEIAKGQIEECITWWHDRYDIK